MAASTPKTQERRRSAPNFAPKNDSADGTQFVRRCVLVCFAPKRSVNFVCCLVSCPLFFRRRAAVLAPLDPDLVLQEFLRRSPAAAAGTSAGACSGIRPWALRPPLAPFAALWHRRPTRSRCHSAAHAQAAAAPPTAVRAAWRLVLALRPPRCPSCSTAHQPPGRRGFFQNSAMYFNPYPPLPDPGRLLAPWGAVVQTFG